MAPNTHTLASQALAIVAAELPLLVVVLLWLGPLTALDAPLEVPAAIVLVPLTELFDVLAPAALPPLTLPQPRTRTAPTPMAIHGAAAALAPFQRFDKPLPPTRAKPLGRVA